MTLRDAVPADLEELSALALRSKGFWGYDAAFLAACADELAVTPARLASERIRVAIAEGTAVGFSALVVSGDEAELVALFVEPARIGGGVGRRLWDDALGHARACGARSLRIEADPFAAAWYEARGARPCGDIPSGSIPGRRIPVLVLAL